MDIIKKVNMHSYRAHVQRSGEPAGGVLMDLENNYFQDYINLLRKLKLKLMRTAVKLDGNSWSILKVSALKVLVGGMFAWREIEVEA